MSENLTPDKNFKLPLRLVTLIKEPGEGLTLLCAFAAAIGGGKVGIRLFQADGNVFAGVAQGLFTVAAVFVVYFFRDRMRRVDKNAEIHKTDTGAQLDFVKIVNELTKSLQDSNSERLREQRESYRETIARLNNKHAIDLANERQIKHDLNELLGDALVSATLINDRLIFGVSDPTLIYSGQALAPEVLAARIRRIKVVPKPALEPDDDIHSTPQ